MNAIVRELDAYQALMKQWFEHLHRHPELSTPATQTAAFIAETLRNFGGHEIEPGIGKPGIVATLKMGDGDKTIGLRADLDALPIREQNDLPYKSEVEGVSTPRMLSTALPPFG